MSEQALDAHLERWERGQEEMVEIEKGYLEYLEAENKRLREALREQLNIRGYAYRGMCDAVPDDVRHAFIALGTPCDDIDKVSLAK